VEAGEAKLFEDAICKLPRVVLASFCCAHDLACDYFIDDRRSAAVVQGFCRQVIGVTQRANLLGVKGGASEDLNDPDSSVASFGDPPISTFSGRSLPTVKHASAARLVEP
jgi:hypothetical protein